MEALDGPIEGLQALLASGDVSAVEVAKAALDRVGKRDAKVRAFLKVDEQGALAAAAASDARRKKKEARGPLEGIPLALKDNLLTEGLETTAGSRILQGFKPLEDATCVRLLREAGAVILGKTNLDEFGMGSSTENSAFHPSHNPYSLAHTPGGSSGGSAAAVAARMVFGALGTDTGGSIRQPAAFCNVVGLKPTYGRVSRRGVVAYASSLDQVGPLARTVREAALLYAAIAKHDPGDATSSDRAVADPLQEMYRGVEGLRVGLVKEALTPELAPRLRAAGEAFAKAGATVSEVALPHTPHAIATYYLVATAEASSNLGRYDGVRYGHRAANVKTLPELYARSRSEGFGREVQRRIMLGTFALSAGYYDAWYGKAQKVRTLIVRDFEKAFASVDVLLLPTSPVPPFKLGEKLADPLQMYLVDAMTLPCSLAGLPGLSIPDGFTADGLPLGLQLIGKAFDEATLLRAAWAYEHDHPHGEKAPVLA